MPLEKARDLILAAVGPGPLVNMGKANALATFFEEQGGMGRTILNYFDHRTVQDNRKPGLNRYDLSDPNFRLWMAIKIISDQDNKMYIRSTTQDRNLFAELIQKGFPQ